MQKNNNLDLLHILYKVIKTRWTQDIAHGNRKDTEQFCNNKHNCNRNICLNDDCSKWQSCKEPVASIQIYFEGAKFFPSGRRGMKPESGDGFLGGGSPPHQLGVWGSTGSSPSGVRGRTPGKFEIWCNLRPQNSLQKCLITCKLLQKG